MKKSYFLIISALFSFSLIASTGVSDGRVSLPDGPGSIEGIGDNVDINPNMGAMSYSVPINVPAGFGGATPSVGLSYSSSGGSTVAGIGWDLGTSSIERLTLRGLPKYSSDDEFSANGSQLVKIAKTGEYSEYRARFEGGFARYRWFDKTDGKGGYWQVEYPDGSKAFFGADSAGKSVATARSGKSSSEIFRYHLVETVDVHGHKVKYSYKPYGNYPLLDKIEYLFKKDGSAKYNITFDYESREDKISDCKAGYEELLGYRINEIATYNGSYTLRKYVVNYEDYETSGGLSRIENVETFGRNNEKYPITYSFQYSDDTDSKKPYTVEMGTVATTFSNHRATLIDINGDALPDIVDSGETSQKHKFFINTLENDTFSFKPAVESSLDDSKGYKLADPNVQTLDINGDGFSDIVNKLSKKVLINGADGDWKEVVTLTDPDAPIFEDDDDDATGLQDGEQLKNVRFFDYNNDRKIDILKSTMERTTIYENTGKGFKLVTGVENIGWGFDSEKLQLSDMNGDGMLDPVYVTEGNKLQYKLNLGYGKWSELKSISGFEFTSSNLPFIELEDMNGDGLSDVVIQTSNKVEYALNKNGATFEPVQELKVEGLVIPTRKSTTTVLYADMNGNGSSDILWIDKDGKVTFLEMFPVRPNLISRIENGIGLEINVDYRSSVEEMANSATEWKYNLPHPNTIVTEKSTGDELSKIYETTRYSYFDGYYDSIEKEFRGYETVEVRLDGDEYQEEGLVEMKFDVGKVDTYKKGLLLESTSYSAGRELSTQKSIYDDCPVADFPGNGKIADKLFPVRFICLKKTIGIEKEGLEESRWVTVSSENKYDGYGNVVLSKNLGVVSVGGKGCDECKYSEDVFGEPCGSSCLGDEHYVETKYVSLDNTNGVWMTGVAYKTVNYGKDDGPKTEKLIYFDGADYEGLALGKLTKGNVSRVTLKVDDNKVINGIRNRYNSDGNVVETIDPNGTVDGKTNRRRYTYGEDGVQIVKTEVFSVNNNGEAYSLRREFSYDPVWMKPAEATSWMYVKGDSVTSPRNSTFFKYDNFGRLVSNVKPGGDTLDSPTSKIIWELGNPVSKVTVKTRSKVGGEYDGDAIKCMDGRGRVYLEKTRVGKNKYLVSGFKIFNVRGSLHTVYQPYESDNSDCDISPKEGTLYSKYYSDSAFRQIKIERPDKSIFGSNSIISTEFEPLATISYDALDNDPDSPYYNTPSMIRTNGLGQNIELTRTLVEGSDDTDGTTTMQYDSLGNLLGYVDDKDNRKTQEFDLLGRILSVNDVNSGKTTYEYDDYGNIVSTTDARGITAITEYDGMNRPVRRWIDGEKDSTLVTLTYDRHELCKDPKCNGVESNVAEVSFPLNGFEGATRGHERYGYDARGNFTYFGVSLDDQKSYYDVTSKFDNVSRVIETSYPNGDTVKSEYDIASRLISLGDYVKNIAYGDTGLVDSIKYGNDINTNYTYDIMSRLSSYIASNSANEKILGFEYKRNRVGHLTEIDDVSVDRDGAPKYGAAYKYDAWYRLIEAELGAGTPQAETLSYKFDTLDNILEKKSSLSAESPMHIGAYSYDEKAANSINKAGNIEFTYDKAGFVTDKDELQLSWDGFGRLSGASRGGLDVAKFIYGSNEKRIFKEERNHLTQYISGNFIIRNGVAVRYVTLEKRKIARVIDKSYALKVLKDYNSDSKIDVVDALLANSEEAEKTGRLLASAVEHLLLEDEPVVKYFHHDHIGSIVMATDENGKVVGQRGYYPFGKERKEKMGYVDSLGFTEQELDESTGLNHFKFRYYDAEVGRWTGVDPLFKTSSAEAMNRWGEATTAFAYVANGPTNATDPTGLILTIEYWNNTWSNDQEAVDRSNGMFRFDDYASGHEGATYQKVLRQLRTISDDTVYYNLQTRRIELIRTEHVRKTKGTNLLRSIIGSDQEIKIIMQKGMASQCDEKIRYDPHMDHQTVQPENNFVVLAHELIHANHHLSGNMPNYQHDVVKLYGNTHYEVAKKEELVTVGLMPADANHNGYDSITENGIRAENGIQARRSYGAKLELPKNNVQAKKKRCRLKAVDFQRLSSNQLIQISFYKM